MPFRTSLREPARPPARAHWLFRFVSNIPARSPCAPFADEMLMRRPGSKDYLSNAGAAAACRPHGAAWRNYRNYGDDIKVFPYDTGASACGPSGRREGAVGAEASPGHGLGIAGPRSSSLYVAIVLKGGRQGRTLSIRASKCGGLRIPVFPDGSDPKWKARPCSLELGPPWRDHVQRWTDSAEQIHDSGQHGT